MYIPSNSHDAQNQYEAELFVQSALDALSAHVAILDNTGTIIGVNASWRQFADANNFNDPQYGIGTNYIAVCDTSTSLNSKDAPLVATGIRDVIAGTKQAFSLEYPCHSPTEKRWFVVRISRFVWYDDVRLIVAHQNVSELKNTQVELERSKHHIEAILDNVNNGIITIDSSGVIKTANHATSRIFAYNINELIGMHLGQLISEQLTDKNSFHRFDGEYGHEIMGIRHDGECFPVYISLNELKQADGSIYTCIIQDITLRKRMDAEILERERVQVALEKERELRVLKNRFLSMMGHELNTPLASISLSYDMIKKYSHLSTPEENEQALDNIQQQVEYLRDMVKDVMAISRSEAEGISVDPENLDLITYCRDVVEEFQFTYHRTHQVEFICDEQDIRAQIDRRTLRRALTNLLSNAIKYSPKGGLIAFTLACDRQQSLVQISVSDAGIGIPDEDLPRLFEPFHRAGNVDTLPGTGLGLAIVKQTIDLHGGTIVVDTKLGKGTTMIITIPMHH